MYHILVYIWLMFLIDVSRDMSTKRGLFTIVSVRGMKVISDEYWNPNLQRTVKHNKKKHSQVIQSDLFIPSWRSLNHLKGSLNHPKKVNGEAAFAHGKMLVSEPTAQAESLACMPAPTRASHLDRFCGYNTSANVGCFLYIVINTCIYIYIYIFVFFTKCMVQSK